jgi:hypothetical protein
MTKFEELKSLFTDNANTPVAFMKFAKEHGFTGNWAGLKEPLYNKKHVQGDLAGTTEPVEGVRFETNTGFVLMALSKNATKAGLENLMKAPASLQVRVDNYNGYQNFTLCTGQSDRETSEVTGKFTI